MNRPMSPDEFRDYLRLLTSLLRLSRHQQAAIAEELRSHLEARFDDLIQRGMDPQQAVSTALAEFGDAAALAAELSAISRLKNRRRIMRLTTGSLIATLLITMAVAALWPDRAGNWQGTTAQAQQEEQAASGEPKETETEPASGFAPADPNDIVWERLEQHTDVEFIDIPLADAMEFLSEQNKFQCHFDMISLEEEGVDLNETAVNLNLKNIPVRMALRLILDPLYLTYTLDQGVVIITSQEAVHQKYLQVRVYGVADLVEPQRHPAAGTGPGSRPPKSQAKPAVQEGSDELGEQTSGVSSFYVQYGALNGGASSLVVPRMVYPKGPPYDITALAGVILHTVDPDSWEETGGGGSARIREFRGALIISQSAENHRKIEKLLNDLRQAVQTAGQPLPAGAAIGGLGGGFGGGGFGGGGFGGGGGGAFGK